MLLLTICTNKTYWSVLEGFLNGKKIPFIPPYFMKINFELISRRRQIFNLFFAKQFTIIDIGCKLPNKLLLYTENTLTMVEFDSECILRMISSLDPNKAHMLSIQVLTR